VIYVDGVRSWSTTGGALDAYLPISSGVHNLVVQAWDKNGMVYKSPLTVTVR
jgi:hypothetical protein